MLETILPCPNCQTSLLVDEQNAGSDVLCPGCEVRLTLPTDLSGAVPPKVIQPADATGPRKNQPLHRSGHLIPPAEDTPPAGEHRTQLPERRGLSPEEEMRRLAALTADPGTFDLHNVDTKGRTAFPCPACHRPVWIAGSEWGREMVCEGCTQTIKAPDPASGEPAKVMESPGGEPRAKTVLPSRRQVENLGVGEQTGLGRSKRQVGQTPAPAPAREQTPPPPTPPVERVRGPVPSREPIPVRGDVELSAPVRKGPPARRTVTPTQEQSAVVAEFEGAAAPQTGGALPTGKFVQRLSTERAPSFTPKHDADLSVEATGNWGGTEPQEQSVAFRRTFTVAILTLILGAVGITAYLLSDYFKEKPARTGKQPAEAESPVQNVDWAKAALQRFFAAQSVEDMAKEVRHPEKTLPRMKDWYAKNGNVRQNLEFTDDWREQDNWQGLGLNLIFTVIKLDGVPQRELTLETFTDGRPPKLDWEDFVAWSETPWIDFLKVTSERPTEFRVVVTLIDYYNGFYSDRSRYLAFRVSDRNNSASCYAYCSAGSDVAKVITASMRTGRQQGRTGPEATADVAEVILRLRFLPEGKEFNQAAIDQVVANSWLEP